ncbi:hypothetical protein AMTRI_Chr08g161610 [Amborella trichopoda]
MEIEGAEKMKRGETWSLRYMTALVTGGELGLSPHSL